MSAQFFPYISFPGNGGEAMVYYHELFGGQLNAMTYGDFPTDPSEFPFEVDPAALAHAQLDAGAVRLTGGDAMSEDAPALRNDVYSFLLQYDTVEEAEAMIEKFTSTGGEIAMPFELAPWGAHYGQVLDKFGILWAFDVEPQR